MHRISLSQHMAWFLVLGAMFAPSANGEPLLTGLLAAESADGPPQVGSAGDISQIRISGSESFSAEEIRDELQRDFAFQAAVRPTADLLSAIDTLRERVIDGYLRAGYLNAQATAGYDTATGGLKLDVVEGERFVAGKIRIENGAGIDSDELIRRLQAPTSPRAWAYAK